MTREDVSKVIQSNQKLDSSSLRWTETLVDKIFEYFESRTCDRCWFYDDDCKVCTNDSVFGMDKDLIRTGAFSTLPNFSCNRWEQK